MNYIFLTLSFSKYTEISNFSQGEGVCLRALETLRKAFAVNAHQLVRSNNDGRTDVVSVDWSFGPGNLAYWLCGLCDKGTLTQSCFLCPLLQWPIKVLWWQRQASRDGGKCTLPKPAEDQQACTAAAATGLDFLANADWPAPDGLCGVGTLHFKL